MTKHAENEKNETDLKFLWYFGDDDDNNSPAVTLLFHLLVPLFHP